MGMFIPEDRDYNEYDRQTGFNRYKQLISRHFTDWLCLNLITLAGAIPLAGGIILSIGSSSILLLIPCSLLGGMIFGPFLAGIFDNLLRAMRDDPLPWFSNYKKSWKQNLTGSLIPGALLGLFIGFLAFMGHLLWIAQIAPAKSSILLMLISIIVMLVITQLYFTQLVLFNQSPVIRLLNILLFVFKHPGKALISGFLQFFYWMIYFLFAPWTLLILPFLGIWYILFLAEFLLYTSLDEAFQIEEQYLQATQKGDAS